MKPKLTPKQIAYVQAEAARPTYGWKKRVARRLGVSRMTVWRAKKYGIAGLKTYQHLEGVAL